MSYIILYLLIGAVAGTLSGLLGIGGGTIVVPALAFIFAHFAQVPSVDVFHFAVATSLATIIATSTSGTISHIRRRNIDWRLAHRLLPGFLMGVILGVAIASYLPGGWLKKAFALFLLFIAIRLILLFQPQSDAQALSMRKTLMMTAMIGVFSSLFGIGLGALGVPFLIRHRVHIHQASAVMLVCTLPVVICGSIGFAISAHKSAYLPHALGYIYLPAWFFVSIASVSCASLGVRLAEKINRPLLQRIFALFLFFVSMTLLF